MERRVRAERVDHAGTHPQQPTGPGYAVAASCQMAGTAYVGRGVLSCQDHTLCESPQLYQMMSKGKEGPNNRL